MSIHTSGQSSNRIIQHIKQLGPGIIMASSAVGGSHIIASTQAGGHYGFQLALFIIAVNVLKYPFYRFAFHYSLTKNKSVLEGYADKGRLYLALFLFFNAVATVVNVAAGTILSAALVGLILPVPLSLTQLSVFVLISYLLILRKKQYSVLDMVSKNIMLMLSVITVLALIMALLSTAGQVSSPDLQFNPPSPWTIAAIPFLIALMGWMPAPMELSVASSLWVLEKQQQTPTTLKTGLTDFNVGYVMTITLALIFMALGALVQYGKGVSLAQGGQYIVQFVDMYAFAIGEWTRWFIGLIAFVCIYGTTIVAVDGYSRTNMVAVNLLLKDEASGSDKVLFYWMLAAAAISFMIIVFFQGSVRYMVPFAMTLSFISAPIFAWLNLTLYRHNRANTVQTSQGLIVWAWIGLIYLLAMLILYFANQFNWLERMAV